MNPLLKKVLGEGEDGIFPEDAKELDKSQDIVGKPLNPVVKVVQEPSKPPGDKEKYLTPYSALTAPDCTPDSMQPLDASKVPGSKGPERFTAADLEKAQEVPQTGLGQEHPTMKAMDAILGRRRTGAVPKNPQEFKQAGAVQTEESAAAMVESMTQVDEAEAAVKAKSFAQTAVVSAQDGGSMPEPTAPGDGRAVLSAFRRFVA